MKRSSKQQSTCDRAEVKLESKIKTAKQAIFVSGLYLTESMLVKLCSDDISINHKNESSTIKLIANILYPLTIFLALVYLLKAAKDYYDYKIIENIMVNAEGDMKLMAEPSFNIDKIEYDIENQVAKYQ